MPLTKRILIIEDNDDTRALYALLLRKLNYDVMEAANGNDGLQLAQAQPPDLILLDVMMPDMDGYAVCAKLREDPRFRTIPILFVTALDGIDDRIRAYTMGGDDYLTKGHFAPKELYVRIEAALLRTQRIQQGRGEGVKGSLIGLLSLRGGVGVSTLALNLAYKAAQLGNQPTFLVDLALPVGSIGLWSGFSGSRHIVELLSYPPGKLTLPLINHFSLQHIQGFFVIPGPTEMVDLTRIQSGTPEQLLFQLREAGYCVILDLGRAVLPLLWRMPLQLDWTVVVTSAEITSRRMAGIALEALPKMGVEQRTVLLALNDLTNDNPVPTALGLPRAPDVTIPYLPDLQDLPETTALDPLWAIVQPETS